MTSRLRHFGIGVNLPRKRGCRGGRCKQRKITVIDHTSTRVITPSSQKADHSINFDNLISVPLHASNCVCKPSYLTVAVFNARSVAQKKNVLPPMILSVTTALTSSAILKHGFGVMMMKPNARTSYPQATRPCPVIVHPAKVASPSLSLKHSART